MAIPILEQRKRLRKLIPILAVVILITLLNFWRGFGSKSNVPPPDVLPAEAKKVEIDWNIIKSQDLEGLDLFQGIPELQQKEGRINPFEPY
ncbi:MAG: hypothetical protein Q7S70_01185 [bacterium]|nr:hypothetical protein [bacterium]